MQLYFLVYCFSLCLCQFHAVSISDSVVYEGQQLTIALALWGLLHFHMNFCYFYEELSEHFDWEGTKFVDGFHSKAIFTMSILPVHE